MKTLLWLLVITGSVNTLFVLIDQFKTPVTLNSRVMDAAFTFFLALWAALLLGGV